MKFRDSAKGPGGKSFHYFMKKSMKLLAFSKNKIADFPSLRVVGSDLVPSSFLPCESKNM